MAQQAEIINSKQHIDFPNLNKCGDIPVYTPDKKYSTFTKIIRHQGEVASGSNEIITCINTDSPEFPDSFFDKQDYAFTFDAFACSTTTPNEFAWFKRMVMFHFVGQEFVVYKTGTEFVSDIIELDDLMFHYEFNDNILSLMVYNQYKEALNVKTRLLEV